MRCVRTTWLEDRPVRSAIVAIVVLFRTALIGFVACDLMLLWCCCTLVIWGPATATTSNVAMLGLPVFDPNFGGLALDPAVVGELACFRLAFDVDASAFSADLSYGFSQPPADDQGVPIGLFPDLPALPVSPPFSGCEGDVDELVPTGERAQHRIAAEVADELDFVHSFDPWGRRDIAIARVADRAAPGVTSGRQGGV